MSLLKKLKLTAITNNGGVMIETKTDAKKNLIAELNGMRIVIVYCDYMKKYVYPMCKIGEKRRTTSSVEEAGQWAKQLLERGYCAWKGLR